MDAIDDISDDQYETDLDPPHSPRPPDNLLLYICSNTYYSKLFFFLMAYRNILQWNCRGIQANFNELQIIANDFDIGIFAYRKLYCHLTNN